MRKIFKGKGKIGDKDAQEIGDYIYKLAEKNNKELDAREVVEVARDNRNILHKYFTWDDNKAADEYRVWEARQLLASVVEIKYIDNKQHEVRSFWNVKSSEESRAYVTYDVVVSNADYIDQLLDDVLEEMDRCRYVIKMFQEHKRKLSLVKR